MSLHSYFVPQQFSWVLSDLCDYGLVNFGQLNHFMCVFSILTVEHSAVVYLVKTISGWGLPSIFGCELNCGVLPLFSTLSIYIILPYFVMFEDCNNLWRTKEPKHGGRNPIFYPIGHHFHVRAERLKSNRDALCHRLSLRELNKLLEADSVLWFLFGPWVQILHNHLTLI